jgi:hypothetical protein
MKKITSLLALLCAIHNTGNAQLKLSQLPPANVWDTGSYAIGIERTTGSSVDYTFKMPFLSRPDTVVFGFPGHGNIVLDTFDNIAVQSSGYFGVYDTTGTNYLNIDVPDQYFSIGGAGAALSLNNDEQLFYLTGNGKIVDNGDVKIADGSQTYLDVNSGAHRFFFGDNISSLAINTLAGGNDTVTGNMTVLEQNDFNVQKSGVLHLDINPAASQYFIGDPTTGMTVNSSANQITLTSSALNAKAVAGKGICLVQTDNLGNLSAVGMGTVASNDVMGLSSSVPSLLGYTTPNLAAAYTYQVGGYVTILASGPSVVFQVSYVDENGAHVTLLLPSVATSAAGSGGVTMATAGQYQIVPATIRCKSSSAITVSLSATGAHFDAGAWIFLMH